MGGCARSGSAAALLAWPWQIRRGVGLLQFTTRALAALCCESGQHLKETMVLDARRALTDAKMRR